MKGGWRGLGLFLMILSAIGTILVAIWFASGFDGEGLETLGVTTNFHQVVDHSRRATNEGTVKCDPAALTCLFSNLFYIPDLGFVIFVKDWSTIIKDTGSFVQPGIGSPSEYFYLDSWTFAPIGLVPESLRNEALHRIEQEKIYTPGRLLRPIFVKPASEVVPQATITLNDITIIFSILWPNNFFRTMYAGAVALFSLYEWNAVAPSPSARINVAMLDFDLPSEGHYRLFEAFYPGQSILSIPKQQEILCFRTAVLGLSRTALLSEVDFQFPDAGYALRSSAYRYFSNIMRRWISEETNRLTFSPSSNNTTINHDLRLQSLQGLGGSCRVLLVARRGGRRQIINQQALIDYLRRLPISLDVIAFEDHPLSEQIRIASRADVMIAVHGAAMTHLMFMKNGATVIELFPFGFRKRIYQNMANLLGINYAVWQCPRKSCSRPNLPGGGGETEVDWRSLESKEFWRNQDVKVDMGEFKKIFNMIYERWIIQRTPLNQRPKQATKYLMYLPWEQFNNQLVGFKSACAVAHFLNRTLIIPPIGHRKPLPADLAKKLEFIVRVFSPKEYGWQSFTRYFSSDTLDELPCRTIPFDAFVGIIKRVGVLLVRRLGQSVRVTPGQLGDYFHYIANLEYEKVASLPVYVPLYFERLDIDKYLRRYDRDQVLCLGTMFWMYSFSGPLEFPSRSFQDKLSDPIYYRITKALQYHPDLKKIASMVRRSLGEYNAIHLRRGDYAQKCYDEGMGASQEPEILRACYQTPNYLIRRIREVQRRQKTRDRPWFLASNDQNLGQLRAILAKVKINFIILSEVYPLNGLDPIELSILDQLACVGAIEFIGNYFSSFTRTIVEQRKLSDKDSLFF